MGLGYDSWIANQFAHASGQLVGWQPRHHEQHAVAVRHRACLSAPCHKSKLMCNKAHCRMPCRRPWRSKLGGRRFSPGPSSSGRRTQCAKPGQPGWSDMTYTICRRISCSNACSDGSPRHLLRAFLPGMIPCSGRGTCGTGSLPPSVSMHAWPAKELTMDRQYVPFCPSSCRKPLVPDIDLLTRLGLAGPGFTSLHAVPNRIHTSSTICLSCVHELTDGDHWQDQCL